MSSISWFERAARLRLDDDALFPVVVSVALFLFFLRPLRGALVVVPLLVEPGDEGPLAARLLSRRIEVKRGNAVGETRRDVRFGKARCFDLDVAHGSRALDLEGEPHEAAHWALLVGEAVAQRRFVAAQCACHLHHVELGERGLFLLARPCGFFGRLGRRFRRAAARADDRNGSQGPEPRAVGHGAAPSSTRSARATGPIVRRLAAVRAPLRARPLLWSSCGAGPLRVASRRGVLPPAASRLPRAFRSRIEGVRRAARS